MAHTPLPFKCTDGLDYVGTHYPAHKNNVYIDCPWCGGKKKLNAVLSGPKEHVFHCAKCDTSANTLIYVAEVRGITSKEAYAELCNYANVPLYERDVKPESKKQEKKEEKPVELLPIKERNKTYRYLLSLFKLEPYEKEDLLKRGFDEEVITRLGYKTYNTREDYDECKRLARLLLNKGVPLKGVPGFYKHYKDWTFKRHKTGLLIPYRDYNARIQGLQIRHRKEDIKGDIPKYLWISSENMQGGICSEGCGRSFLHFATDFKWNEDDGINEAILDKEIVLTEGALKADLFHHLTGMPCLAMPGVNAYQPFIEVLDLLKEKGVKKIYLAFDMDYMDKIEVKRAEEKIKEIILTAGFQFARAKWDPTFKGIDDYYAFKKKGIK